MNSLSLRETGRTLCEIGGAILAVVALKDFGVTYFRVPATLEWPWRLLAEVGVALVGIGAVIWIISSVLALGDSLRVAVGRISVSRTGRTFRFAFAKSTDLPLLYSFYKSHFSEDTPSMQLMESWLKKCETAFVLQYELSDVSQPKLVGSFKLLPLSKKGIRDLEFGATSGSRFAPDHLCSSPTRASAFYVGDLCAEGTEARAVIVKELEDMCSELVDRGRPIYARPFTAHGRQVMVNRHFVHVSDGDTNLRMRELCRLDSKTQNSSFTLRPRLNHNPRRQKPR